MYHSKFYEMLYSINTEVGWRSVLGTEVPDLHMKDIEILLRGFAMLIDGDKYSPSMVRFLNHFSKACSFNDPETNQHLEQLFSSFIKATRHLPKDAFLNKKNNRFNIALYEATFTAACTDAYKEKRVLVGEISNDSLLTLSSDPSFIAAASKASTGSANVELRLARARTLITPL